MKKSHSQLGDFFTALKKREEKGWNGGAIRNQKHCAVGAKKVSPPRRAVQEFTTLCLDRTDLLMEADAFGYASAVEVL